MRVLWTDVLKSDVWPGHVQRMADDRLAWQVLKSHNRRPQTQGVHLREREREMVSRLSLALMKAESDSRQNWMVEGLVLEPDIPVTVDRLLIVLKRLAGRAPIRSLKNFRTFRIITPTLQPLREPVYILFTKCPK